MSGPPGDFYREKRMARNLMIQGTMSGAGKSILTAGILRVLRQDGFRTAPFKSQNMALNSFVTRDGLEMGRAQVVQAAAAGMEPSADMNPILLKPMGDTTSQVIVNGKPIGKMRASEYYRIKRSLVPQILEAYHRLEEQADIIVIEGAGSPVEINLREGDFVNMGLAGMVDAPVLLAGNIDPGGVFAQLLGTVQLMRPEERGRVKGLIINKFRGDVSLLEPGLSMFREYCDIPFAGVVPWVRLELDEEDSMSEMLSAQGRPFRSEDVDIAVIRFPYISNYTDFAPLSRTEGVKVRYVSSCAELGTPDLIILPGTKNTLGDLRWLRETGLAEKISAMMCPEKERSDGRTGGSCGDEYRVCGPEEGNTRNTPLLIGICGGYQMLGKKILDPLGSEAGGEEKGLGLLPVVTVFREGKYTRQTNGRTCRLPEPWTPLADLPVFGYEIHMGDTKRCDDGIQADELPAGAAFAVLGSPQEPDGAVFGSVMGTYLHGVFDEPELRGALVNLLMERNSGEFRGTGERGNIPAAVKMESARQMQEKQLDILADVLRESLDWKLIYEAIGI